jgi:hypothetical protein
MGFKGFTHFQVDEVERELRTAMKHTVLYVVTTELGKGQALCLDEVGLGYGYGIQPGWECDIDSASLFGVEVQGRAERGRATERR